MSIVDRYDKHMRKYQIWLNKAKMRGIKLSSKNKSKLYDQVKQQWYDIRSEELSESDGLLTLNGLFKMYYEVPMAKLCTSKITLYDKIRNIPDYICKPIKFPME